MFIRSRQRGENAQRSHYVVESYRDVNGKPRQRELLYLGKHKTIEAYIKALQTRRREVTADIDARVQDARSVLRSYKKGQ